MIDKNKKKRPPKSKTAKSGLTVVSTKDTITASLREQDGVSALGGKSWYIPPDNTTNPDRISRDRRRYKERLHSQRNIDKELEDVVDNGRFSSKEKVKIRVRGVEEPHFVFGRDGKGGGGGGGGNKGGQGSDDSLQGVEIEVDADELDALLFKGLELPNMLRKRGGKTEVVGYRVDGLDRQGARGELDLKTTMRRRTKRAIALGKMRPELLDKPGSRIPSLKSVPITRQDKRFWQFGEVREPISQAVYFILIDYSPSMRERERAIAMRYALLKFRFLRRQYKHVDIVMIAHGTKPFRAKTEEEFVNMQVDGGTAFVPSLKEILKIAKKEYPADEWNLYMDMVTDGENSEYDESEEDMIRSMKALLDYPLNFIGYIEIPSEYSMSWGDGTNSWQRGGRVFSKLPAKYLDRMLLAKVWDMPSLLRAFVRGLSKDAAKKTR